MQVYTRARRRGDNVIADPARACEEIASRSARTFADGNNVEVKASPASVDWVSLLSSAVRLACKLRRKEGKQIIFSIGCWREWFLFTGMHHSSSPVPNTKFF